MPARLTACSLALAALALCSAALAQGAPPDRQARLWAATCAACHGAGAPPKGDMPSLAGAKAEQIARALLEFKNGQRPAATVMHQHAKGYTDDELRRIAQAIADTSR